MFGGNSSWLVIIILGGLAGALAKLLMPGRDPGGCIITILLGIAEFSPYLFDLIRADAERLIATIDGETMTALAFWGICTSAS